MAASNKKRKKLARELQAETGLRYTDALERVRLRTTKEERMQVAQNSPLLRAIQKQKEKIDLETPEADALRPKVEEAVQSILAVLAELPIRHGIRGVGFGSDLDDSMVGGMRPLGIDDQVQVAIGKHGRHHLVDDGMLELWLNGPMSMHMEQLPKTVQILVEGDLEDPSSWKPNVKGLRLHSLRAALQICGWLTGPENPRSTAAALEEEFEPLEVVRTRKFSRIEKRRKSILQQIEEEVHLGFTQALPSAEAVLEKKVGEVTPEAKSVYGGVSWSGDLVLESDAPELLLVTEIEIGGETLKVGLFASCFRRDAEPVVRFQEREIPEGSRVVVRLKNLDDAVPHAVTGFVRVRPSSLSFDRIPAERQVSAAVLVDDGLDLG